MQCNDFEVRMQRLLDRRRRPELDSELTTHALGCCQCGDMLETQSLLFDGLEHAALPRSPRQLGVEVVRQYGATQPDRADRLPTRRLVPLGVLAAALSLLAIAPLNYYWNRGNTEIRSDAAIALSVTTPRSVGAPASHLETGGSRELAETTPSLLALQELSLGLPDSERIAMGLRPLTYTFNFAFDALRRTFVDPFTEFDPAMETPDVISLIL